MRKGNIFVIQSTSPVKENFFTIFKIFGSLKFCTFIKYILILLSHHCLLTFFSASYPVFSHISCHHMVSFVGIDNVLSQMSIVSMRMECGHSLENGQPISIGSPKESDSFSFGNHPFSIAVLPRIGPWRVLLPFKL